MIYSTNYEIVQQPQHKSRGTKKYRHRLKLKGLATTMVYFFQTCVFTEHLPYLYRIIAMGLLTQKINLSDIETTCTC